MAKTKITSYRDAVENVEITWITMPDGRKLAARLLLPRDKSAKVPCIFEYIPYRRRDGTRSRDDETHYWFAAHGYGVARVDIAGSGDSEGLIQDEYHVREQDDAMAIIAWLAAQDWCSGSVGMIGISWGGFNGLQVAARRPPALKAVVSIASTVDRYADDVHFMGGCLLNDIAGLGRLFLHLRIAAARSRHGWTQPLEGDVATSPRQSRLLSDAVAGASAPRCILETWLGLRGL